MSRKTMVSLVFGASAVYDGFLGLAFVIAAPLLFARCGVTPPNHFGYVQFPAAILIVFALMFGAIARDPVGNRNLMPYGILLKVAYCAVVFGYWFTTDIPFMWKPFALCDLVFIGLFVWGYVSMGKEAREKTDR